MKKLLITALMLIGLVSSAIAQDEVIFTIMKTDGSTTNFAMDKDARIYYSDTKLFFKSNDEIFEYNLSELRKAYFTTTDNIEEADNHQVTVYPNPATDVLKIKNLSDNQAVTIYSIDGKIINKKNVSDEAEINISDLKPGLYIIGVGNKFSKFIKL